MLTVLPLVLIPDVGLIIKLKLMSSPFDIPPKIPPELFEEYPEEVISSLASEPLSPNKSSAFPIDTDLTALIAVSYTHLTLPTKA